MTWHQWHQTAPISRRMGLSSARARAKASSPHSYHSTGWWAAERRYGLAELARRLGCSALKFFLPLLLPSSFSLKRPHRTRLSLHGIIRAGIARIEGLAPGEAFILPMPEADALFAEAPAKINLFVIDDGRKIQQAGIEVLDQTAGGLNPFERGLERLRKFVVFETQPGRFLVRNDGAADPLNARGNSSQFLDQRGKFLSHLDGFDEHRFDLAPCAFGLGERE